MRSNEGGSADIILHSSAGDKDAILSGSIIRSGRKDRCRQNRRRAQERVDIAVLNKIARYGYAPEVFIPIPSLIRENPRLVGYYRLLYGNIAERIL